MVLDFSKKKVIWDKFSVAMKPMIVIDNGREAYVTFNALTCIDPVTNLTELIRIDGKTAAHIGAKFEQGWLSRYPRPMQCIHNNGGEFTGEHFQLQLQTNGIKDVPTTVKNPQANSICE
eukprot:scaffold19697_cov30-Attheya_sp.AAC.1